MTTSGRSESIHAFFDGYLNSHTMLNDFVVKYDVAVKARREAENHEDFRTLNTKPVLCTGHHIEEQAGRFYTRVVFNLFQVEWKKSFDLMHEKIGKDGALVTYKVGVLAADRMRWRNVVYQSIGDTYKCVCSCAKFEISGILCKHILFIMRKKSVTFISKESMLDRWSIDSRYKICSVGSISCREEAPNLMAWSIRARVNKLLEDARHNPNLLRKVAHFLDSSLAEADDFNRSLQFDGHMGCGIEDYNVSEFVPDFMIHDPIAPVKAKGRLKKVTRIKSGLESSQEVVKQKNVDMVVEKDTTLLDV